VFSRSCSQLVAVFLSWVLRFTLLPLFLHFKRNHEPLLFKPPGMAGLKISLAKKFSLCTNLQDHSPADLIATEQIGRNLQIRACRFGLKFPPCKSDPATGVNKRPGHESFSTLKILRYTQESCFDPFALRAAEN